MQLALGGIVLENPSSGPARPIPSGTRAVLYENEDAAYREERDQRLLIVHVESPVSRLAVGGPVLYRDVTIGEVGTASLTQDASAVRTTLRIQERYGELVRTNSIFWPVSAVSLEAGMEGVSVEVPPIAQLIVGGLQVATPADAAPAAAVDTVFTLSDRAPDGYETWRPSIELPGSLPAREFVVSNAAPVRFPLSMSTASMIGEGDPVLFRGITVGRVRSPSLDAEGTSVVGTLEIEPRFAHLVRENSRFWPASAVDVELGWAGLDVDIAPVDTLLRGGLVMATPPPAGRHALESSSFAVEAAAPEGWREWSPSLDGSSDGR